jgi:hypothetical protein
MIDSQRLTTGFIIKRPDAREEDKIKFEVFSHVDMCKCYTPCLFMILQNIYDFKDMSDVDERLIDLAEIVEKKIYELMGRHDGLVDKVDEVFRSKEFGKYISSADRKKWDVIEFDRLLRENFGFTSEDIYNLKFAICDGMLMTGFNDFLNSVLIDKDYLVSQDFILGQTDDKTELGFLFGSRYLPREDEKFDDAREHIGHDALYAAQASLGNLNRHDAYRSVGYSYWTKSDGTRIQTDYIDLDKDIDDLEARRDIMMESCLVTRRSSMSLDARSEIEYNTRDTKLITEFGLGGQKVEIKSGAKEKAVEDLEMSDIKRFAGKKRLSFMMGLEDRLLREARVEEIKDSDLDLKSKDEI